MCLGTHAPQRRGNGAIEVGYIVRAGVFPLGVHVRRTTGWSMKPLSSIKTMGQPLAWDFLTFAHPSLRHVAIAFSSRSRARRSGFWQLHPMSRRMYQTWPGLYFTPNSRSITCATRASVHNSVGKPAARAPFKSTRSNSFFCSAVNGAGRPGWGFAWRASIPTCSFRFHPETVEGAAPTKRATSRTPFPCRSIRPAIRRRASNASALPLGLMSP